MYSRSYLVSFSRKLNVIRHSVSFYGYSKMATAKSISQLPVVRINQIAILFHYANTPMKYTTIFHGCENVNFQMKNYYIFLIFAQNIDCGYTLEPPH